MLTDMAGVSSIKMGRAMELLARDDQAVKFIVRKGPRRILSEAISVCSDKIRAASCSDDISRGKKNLQRRRRWFLSCLGDLVFIIICRDESYVGR